MSKQKVFTILMYFTLFLIILNLAQGIVLFFKHAYLSSLFLLVISHSLIGWYFYIQEILSSERYIEKIEEYYNAQCVLLDIRKTPVAYNLDKIIELSEKRMVNGLSDEDYVKFINDILGAINAFANRSQNILGQTLQEFQIDTAKKYFNGQKEGQECQE